jgi:predicted nucleic acid-binding protein
MTWLLDVNALVALGFAHHEFHHRVALWAGSQASPSLATCPITELGFVRVLARAQAYGTSLTQARTMLLRLKQSSAFTFVPDDLDITHLPAWVKSLSQSTDGYLARLARAHGATLATLDRKIPGAFLIPLE